MKRRAELLGGDDGRKRAHADDKLVEVEVTTAEGVTLKIVLPPTAKVLEVLQEVERKHGIDPRGALVFLNDCACDDRLDVSVTLENLQRSTGGKVELSLLVEKADAQQVVPELASEPSTMLGDGTEGSGDLQLFNPNGIAFFKAHPDWVVITEYSGDRIKISNTRTGATVFKIGTRGSDKGQFVCPLGVAVSSDSTFVFVADFFNHRVQVFRLVISADGSSGSLECVRFIGKGTLKLPKAVTLLPSEGGQETLLVTDDKQRVTQFALDGTFIRIFAGTGSSGIGNGEFNDPIGMAVLSASEVAVVDRNNHRVQIFDSEGNYKRKFGSKGKEDGQLNLPLSVASDAHGNLIVTDITANLQVFSPEGKHLCTRNNLGINSDGLKVVAWSPDGSVAIVDSHKSTALIWHAVVR
jgi:DNA-binding beta-propeller fold protein YncE